MLAVVAFHSLVVERKYSGGDSLMPDWFVFGESGVDLFFVISGYVMVTDYPRALRKDQGSRPFRLGPRHADLSDLLVLLPLDPLGSHGEAELGQYLAG